MKKISRRETLKSLVPGAMVLSMPTIIPRSVFGANDRIRVAVIGHHGRGKNHIQNFMKLANVELATLCDVDDEVNKKGAAEFEKTTGKKVTTATDMRKVFDDKNIDAVSIATPNHWHALATLWACQAGKDVYVEKPASHDFNEGRVLMLQINTIESYPMEFNCAAQLRYRKPFNI